MAKVSMYTISTCPVCRKTKEFFRARGIPFDFVDYDLASESEQNTIAAEMMKGTLLVDGRYAWDPLRASNAGLDLVRIGTSRPVRHAAVSA